MNANIAGHVWHEGAVVGGKIVGLRSWGGGGGFGPMNNKQRPAFGQEVAPLASPPSQ